ncbi:tRNA (N(6)-L-threonylcarbamoyladenosine(37)-C(2))-methylthiotransferase MtaB [Caloramator sp. E03]|uniref:tRNA (N(6)-L-threonylcarbamoyladenosine(37)-C(2))- methylthiotransferase MtaB n=1 Tax=Caloramator sp. E03 TaxID=2576307 RepID=UPI0011104672|nr:tRNA (N(6)-L-threonylcarbamoyladenosine(37)-C(2))-methylthiotransferase MtaB [Caloramator sp. E03]QCX32412.1 tRNA (N(6)-L-threonylcarbamoyladenosine(37)-C(2))-methylthiotransferase MtaB [Caloramator sp. E03]
MKKVAFYTLGCRVNQYETEAIAEVFIKDGYEVVDFDEFANVYVINTCSVTNISDKKSRNMIRKAKKLNPEAVVVAAGCYSQVAPEEVASIEGVDIVVGTTDKIKIPQIVKEYLKEKKPIKHVENIMNIRTFEEMEIEEYQDRTRAFLKIQDGCENFCSYCLIPFARGPVRSKNPDKVLSEVKKLALNGYKEVILSGIHVASYGKDLGNVDLVSLIENINDIEGIERIRIGSVDPTFFTDNRIESLSKVKKLCNHFHLSLQSGCDETLKRMNRHYTTGEYKGIVTKLREKIQDVSISTDIIVGFPGETDEEFNETYKFLEDIKLSKMHIFKYSERKGTRAEKLPNKVDPLVKEIRSQKLIKLDEIFEESFIKKFINSEMKVLFEEGDDGIYFGYTTNYIKVMVKSKEDITGKIMNVKLVNCLKNVAEGNLI